MRAVSLANGNRSQKTFEIALGLLGLVALAQIIGAFILHRQRPREVSTIGHTTTVGPATIAAASSVGPAKLTPTRPALPIAKNNVRNPSRAVVSIPDELLQVAKALRAQGDTGDAVAKLQQAAALAPQNPEILAELALTYESMQLFDRSSEAWRRLQSLGVAAGPLGELADMKLRMGAPVAGIPGSTGQSTSESAPPNSVSDIPDGSSFGISQVTQTTASNAEDLTKIALRVGVKVRPGT